jgi:CheY-like chemotaxis protein
MPVMDGMAATQEIRKLEHNRRQRPSFIIALTGLGSAAARQEALSSGMDMFLTKPVRLKDLQEILDNWLLDKSIS